MVIVSVANCAISEISTDGHLPLIQSVLEGFNVLCKSVSALSRPFPSD